MISATSAKQVGPFLEFEICPNNNNGQCNCEHTVNDLGFYTEDLLDPHRVFYFVSEPPEEYKSKKSWAEHCLHEAMLLIRHENTSDTQRDLSKLVGASI